MKERSSETYGCWEAEARGMRLETGDDVISSAAFSGSISRSSGSPASRIVAQLGVLCSTRDRSAVSTLGGAELLRLRSSV